MLEKFEKMLLVFSAAVTGRKIQSIDLNPKELYELSAAQRVWPIVFGYLKKNTSFRFPENLEKLTSAQIYNNMVRVINVSKKAELLEKNGIRCCILKGATLSGLYADPYSRLTTDTDIFVSPEDEERACKILAESGLSVEERKAGSHHAKCTGLECGMIELHTECFDPVVEDLWFDGASFFDYNFIPFSFEGVSCHALCHTEALVFVFLHFVKHYIAGLVTVRHLTDTLLYFRKYKNEIDLERVFGILDRLGYRKFFLTCIAFGTEYLAFENSDFDLCDAQKYKKEASLLLSDLFYSSKSEDCGVFTEYGKKVYGRQSREGSYDEYFRKKNSGGVLKMAKVSREALEEKYPSLKKHPALYPFFYVKRAVLGLFRVFFPKKTPENAEKNRRLEILEKLGL